MIHITLNIHISGIHIQFQRDIPTPFLPDINVTLTLDAFYPPFQGGFAIHFSYAGIAADFAYAFP
jgi:hypothetical protein